ncbi:hypothetical protein [Oceanicoccus sagamiensis]|uniref:Uncharacterized protein n=1 Tax=Oceanicoccus sagamiensis TaxID=716816 RepID=A0A1X9NAG8_9GAMM|nr:hypothetical protein [Oceanicoccus sagamiensis]ARN72925.1 hypothetical protein BST96_01675 [Oceanicoccus sagamiensis]
MIEQRNVLISLLALITIFLGQALSRTINRVIVESINDWMLVGFIAVGIAGVIVLATQINTPGIKGTLSGFIAGLLIWRGFVDGPMRVFAEIFSMGAIDFGGFPLSGRYALLMSTLPVMLAMLVLYGLLSQETRCNFMRFTLRCLRWSPGKPTPAMPRSVARITAVETVFVQWGIFLLFLFLGGALSSPFYIAMLVWLVYLLYQLLKLSQVDYAFRYAIPVCVILFSLVEVGAFFGLYPEPWQKPAEYPVTIAVMSIVFIGCLFQLVKMQKTKT